MTCLAPPIGRFGLHIQSGMISRSAILVFNRIFTMKTLVHRFLLLVALTAPSVAHAGSGTTKELSGSDQANMSIDNFTAADYKPGTVQHIVLFAYRDSVSPKKIMEVRERFLALKHLSKRNGKPYILDIQAGAQNSGEGVAHGFQEGFIVSFRSEGDRNYYVGSPVVTDPRFFDPEHEKFKEFVGPLLAEKDGVLVFDFDADGQ